MSAANPIPPAVPPFAFKIEADPNDPMHLRAVLNGERAAAELARWARQVEEGRYTAELVRLGWTPPGAARPAPAWDEEAVVEGMARALFQRTYPGSTTWDTLPVGGLGKEVWRESAKGLLAVVREHLPVKPDREAVAAAVCGLTRAEWDCLPEATREELREVGSRPTNGVLNMWPGRSEAEVRAETLAPIRAALAGHPACDVHPDDDPVSCGWKRAVADVRAALDA